MKPRRRTPAERKALRRTGRELKKTHGRVLVEATRLAPNNSWEEPEFVRRGHYVDQPFSCRDCGKAQVWTATQQKWWYEVARGGLFTVASRCPACRRRERERREEARRVHQEGLAAKQAKRQKRELHP